MSRPRTIGVLLVLASLSAAPVLTRRAGVTEAPSPPGGPVPEAHLASSNGRPGIGVELQVMNLHLEVAWFDAVPVSPGRSLVLSWLARGPRGE